MLPRHLPAHFNVLAGMVEIMPPRIYGQRPQHNTRAPAGLFSHAGLRAVEGAHHDIEDISLGQKIELPVDHAQHAFPFFQNLLHNVNTQTQLLIASLLSLIAIKTASRARQ